GDFGLARAALQPALGGATASSPGQSGSLRYQAPEVVRGLPATERSDLYSLAVVLHECLTGDHPVPPGLEDYETRQWIVEGPPVLLPKRVPERVRAAVEKGLARDPAQRFASAAVFAATLRAELRARP